MLKYIYFLTFIVTLSCNKKIEIQSFENLKFKNVYTVILDSVKSKNVCIKCLFIKGVFNINNKKCLALIDYYPSKIYIYDIIDNKFLFNFSIPRDSFIANVLAVKSIDSILYLNNGNHFLAYSDTTKLYSKYSTQLNQINGNLILHTSTNELIEFDNKYFFQISLLGNQNTLKTYKTILAKSPMFGYFDFSKKEKNYFPLTNILYSKEGKKIVSNSIVYCVNKSKLIFNYKVCDTLYIYDYVKNELTKKYFANTVHKIEPIYYGYSSKSADEYSKAMNQQNTISTLIYDARLNLYFRILNFENTGGKRFLQIIDKDFELISEYYLPENTELCDVNNALLFRKVIGNKIIYDEPIL